MTLRELAVRIAAKEGGKVQMNIAQIYEVLKAINSLFPKNLFYTLVKWL